MNSRARWTVGLVLGSVVVAMVVVLAIFATGPSGAATPAAGTPTTPIKHVVVIMMENHTFDNLFGTFPGANGVTLSHAADPIERDYDHTGPATLAALDGGKLDEFPVRSKIEYRQADEPTYWAYAAKYGLSDNFFSSVDLQFDAKSPCDGRGPRPATTTRRSTAARASRRRTCCSTHETRAPSKLLVVPVLLDQPAFQPSCQQAGVSWRYYSAAQVWDTPSYIKGLAGSANDIHNSNQFVTDVKAGKMPQVAWVTPDGWEQRPSTGPAGAGRELRLGCGQRGDAEQLLVIDGDLPGLGRLGRLLRPRRPAQARRRRPRIARTADRHLAVRQAGLHQPPAGRVRVAS